MSTYTVKEHLCLTEDETRLVPETSPDAAWLFAIPGQEIPLEVAETFGLVAKGRQPRSRAKV